MDQAIAILQPRCKQKQIELAAIELRIHPNMGYVSIKRAHIYIYFHTCTTISDILRTLQNSHWRWRLMHAASQLAD